MLICVFVFGRQASCQSAGSAPALKTPVYVDGKLVGFGTVSPADHTTYVPLRAVATALKASVDANGTRIDVTSAVAPQPAVPTQLLVTSGGQVAGNGLSYLGVDYLSVDALKSGLGAIVQGPTNGSLDISVPPKLPPIRPGQYHSLMKGLSGVVLVISTLDGESATGQEVADEVKTQAEIKLREAGLQVFSSLADAPSGQYIGILSVSVAVMDDIVMESTSYVCSYRIEFSRPVVFLPERQDWIWGAVWSDPGGTLIYGDLHIAEIKASPLRLVDRFVSEYLAENPK